MGVDELIDQAGFPHARLPNQCHHLPMACPGALQRLLQRR
jgi:hypothetical protein